VLSVIRGIVALGRIKMFGQRGRGLAIAGLAVSGDSVVVLMLVLVLVNLSRAPFTYWRDHSRPTPERVLAIGRRLLQQPARRDAG
jgi:hypothetical protein